MPPEFSRAAQHRHTITAPRNELPRRSIDEFTRDLIFILMNILLSYHYPI